MGVVLTPAVQARTFKGSGARDAPTLDVLLAEAGHPQGFAVDCACPNNRHIDNEESRLAVKAMCSRIGLLAQPRTLPRAARHAAC